MNAFIPAALLSAIYLCYLIYKRFSRISISHIRGPKPDSFLLGNLPQLAQGQAGETEIKWSEEFGGVVRMKAPLGEDRLLISDPKALRYVLHTGGYTFPKPPERVELVRMLAGRGILWSDGDVHKRHRKIIQPAFSALQCKSFLPIFRGIAARLSSKWQAAISTEEDETTVVDVHAWLFRATMDAVGEASFDHQFGMLENGDSPLTKAYFNMMADAFGGSSKLSIFAQNIISQYLPTRLVNSLSDKWIPSERLERLRQSADEVNKVGQQFIDEKYAALRLGKGGRDVMSLLVNANASTTVPTARLNAEEMLAQIRTLMFAGHETIGNTLSWTLYELARNPHVQARLRAEIRGCENMIAARGDSEFTQTDFESMTYTLAVMKESLRLHTVVLNIYRQTSRDDVLPLSKPIVTRSGEVIDELPVPKGMKVQLSLAAYHRNKDIFGQDVHVFNPERWLDGKMNEMSVGGGIFSNLLSFSGGVRSCVGWRFAMLELQAFIVELISNFEFSVPEDVQVHQSTFLFMIPTVVGKTEKGGHLPLRVRAAER